MVFGFDLVDYHTVANYVRGIDVSAGFLIWTRPVNPISGLILLFVFLLCLWLLLTKSKRLMIIPAGAALALMMASYFFSWSVALAIVGSIGLRALVLRRWKNSVDLCLVVITGVVLALPYWIMVWRAAHLPWYVEASARIGLLTTHAPHLNKFLFFCVVIFLLASCMPFFIKKNKLSGEPLEAWWFCLSFLLAGFLAYNQQVITGREIWYYHYVFFTIPLGYVALLVASWYFFRPYFRRLWLVSIVVIGVASLWLGVYTQVSAYKHGFPYFKNIQSNAQIFNYFNKAPLDCVVLANEDDEGYYSINIPAFTHCNTYVSRERFVIAPLERFYHNYLVFLRLRGITAEQIVDYIATHHDEGNSFLYAQLQSKLGYPDPVLAETLRSIPDDYKAFLKKDFLSELKKYRLDYILSIEPLSPSVQRSLPSLLKVFQSGQIYIYTLGEIK